MAVFEIGTWLREKFTAEDVPNKTDICARVLALPLPEADRRTLGPFLSRKPKTLDEWTAKYGSVKWVGAGLLNR